MTALFIWQVRTIVRSPHTQLRAVATLAAVATLQLLFAASYFLLQHDTPGSFTEPLSRTDALYFALTVLSTVGFGDSTARSETARVMPGLTEMSDPYRVWRAVPPAAWRSD